MKAILQYNSKFIINIIYSGVMFLICVGLTLLILRIQTKFGGNLINLRFNVYEGITMIDSARYVWQYLIYAVLFSIINGLGIWYIQKRFINSSIQNTIIYWIFGSSVLVLSLLAYYLALVLNMNNISN